MAARSVRLCEDVTNWLIALAATDREAAGRAHAAISMVAHSTTTSRLGMLTHAGYAVMYELDDQEHANVTDCRIAPRGYPPMM